MFFLEGRTDVGKTTAAPAIVVEMLKDGRVTIVVQGDVSTKQMIKQFANKAVHLLLNIQLGRHVNMRAIEAEDMNNLEGKVLPKLENADVVIMDRRAYQQIRLQADNWVGASDKMTEVAVRVRNALENRNTLLEEAGTVTGEINLTTSERKKPLIGRDEKSVIEIEKDLGMITAMEQVRRALVEMAFSREGDVKLNEIQEALSGEKNKEELMFAVVGEAVERLYPQLTQKQLVEGLEVEGRNFVPKQVETFERDFLHTMFRDKIDAGGKIEKWRDVDDVVGEEYAHLLEASYNEGLNAIGATGGKYTGGSGREVILPGAEHGISIREGLVTTSRDLVEGNEILMGMKVLIQNPMFAMKSSREAIERSKPGPVISFMDVLSASIKKGRYVIGTGAGINVVQKEVSRQLGALYVSSGENNVLPNHVKLIFRGEDGAALSKNSVLRQRFRRANENKKGMLILEMGEVPLNTDIHAREYAKTLARESGREEFDILIMDDT